MMETIKDFVGWFKQLMANILEFFIDLPLRVFMAFLDGVASVIEAIDVPGFISNGLQPLTNSLPSWLQFFMSQTQMDTGLAILAAGVAFRLMRKLVTLGRW